MQRFVPFVVLGATLFLTASALSAQERALYTLTNDELEVIVNDTQYPFDDFGFPSEKTQQFWNLNLGFHDGESGYYFSSTPGQGALPLVLLGPPVEEGADPAKTVTMSFGDAASPTRFRIDLRVSMSGNGSRGVAVRATVTNLVEEGRGALAGTRLYLFGDLSLDADDANDVTAWDAEGGFLYGVDTAAEPDVYFGCKGATTATHHYLGRPYDGGGLNALRLAVATGADLGDTVDPTPSDQIAGWNWNLGAIETEVVVDFALAADSDLVGLKATFDELLPATESVFSDGFESGDTAVWN